MKLQKEDLNLIRKLDWSITDYGNRTYNTVSTPSQTKLFWIDFLTLVFAPKFASQKGVTNISTFDTTQPVLLTDDLELVVPTPLDTAWYFAINQHDPPKTFVLNGINYISTFIITTIILIILVFINMFYSSKNNNSLKVIML